MLWVALIRALVWILAGSVVAAAFFYGLRFYELANGGWIPPLYARDWSPRRIAASVGAFAREWGAIIVLTLIRPLGWGGRSQRYGGRDGRPVVLVPGFMMNRSCLWFLARRIGRTGRPVYTLNLRTTHDVRKLGSDLAYFVEDVLRETGARSVDLVGYSMGGLVCRYYVERLEGAARTRHVVTLATPHRGTRLSVLALGTSARQMRPGSSLLADLQAAGLSASVRYTAVYSMFDAFVLPPVHAALPEPASTVQIEGCGHGGLLLSRRFADAVLEALKPAAAVEARGSASDRGRARVRSEAEQA